MRYQIHSLQHQSLYDLDMNTEDALLLDWFLHWKDGNGMEYIQVGNDLAYWVNYGKVVEELKIMFKKTPPNATELEKAKIERNNRDKVARMLKGNLSKVFIKHEVKVQGKTKVYLQLKRDVVDFLVNNDNKKAPTVPPVEAKDSDKNKIAKPNNSICNNKYYNACNTKNKEENIVNKDNEVAKAIENSLVNIKKADYEEAIEAFTDIDKLNQALAIAAERNNHGIKALKGIYNCIGKAPSTAKGFNNMSSERFSGMNENKMQQMLNKKKEHDNKKFSYGREIL